MGKRNLNVSSGSNGAGKGFLHGSDTTADGGGFDWSHVPPSEIAELIGLVTSRGGAIRFGYSRDGQAGSVGIYYGNDRDTVYLRPNEDFSEGTGVITRAFESFPNTGGKAPSSAG